jgi:hypothetical protein
MGFALYPASRFQYVFKYIILIKVANGFVDDDGRVEEVALENPYAYLKYDASIPQYQYFPTRSNPTAVLLLRAKANYLQSPDKSYTNQSDILPKFIRPTFS